MTVYQQPAEKRSNRLHCSNVHFNIFF